MPGLIAAFSMGDQKIASCFVESISQRMYAGFDQKNSRIFNSVDEKVAVCARHGERGAHGWVENEEGLMFWIGQPFLDGTPLKADLVKDSLPTLPDELASFASKLYGHFHIVSFNKQKQRFSVVTDLMSSFPCYTTVFQNTVVITPEAVSLNALKKLGWAPTLRKSAVYEILGATNLVFDGTYWSEVTKQLPATVASWDMSGKKNIKNYFNFPSEQKPFSMTKKEFMDSFYNSIAKDMEEMPAGNLILSLSGGYDSRAMLGYINEKKIPAKAMSYSFGHVFKEGFDLEVGEYFAQKTGMEFYKFHADPTQSERLIKNFDRVILSTGGEVDAVLNNCGFLGNEYYEWLLTHGDTLLRGDVLWGRGDVVTTTGTAFWRNSIFKITDILTNSTIMKPDAYVQAVTYMENKREQIIAMNELFGKNPNVLKDFLAWINRSGRVVRTVCYHNSCHIDQQSPFIYGNALKFSSRLPWKLRMKKKLFHATMLKYYPDLFLDNTKPTKMYPIKSAGSLAMEQKCFYEYVWDLLVENPPEIFRECFDIKAIEKLIPMVLDERHSSSVVKSYNLKRKIHNIATKNEWLVSHLLGWAEKRGKAVFPYSPAIMIFRLITIALAIRAHSQTG